MITFEEIICKKDKEERDSLIKEKLLELNNSSNPVVINTNSIMTGFINNNSKVKFSDFHYDLNIGLGSIYGMKTDDYFYEFFDFLSEHNFITKKDVVKYVASFLKNYFDERGKKDNDREYLFDNIWRQLDAMYEQDKERFEKCRESWLDIGIFKGRSVAECSEHACITQNLLTFCDIDCCFIAGHMKSHYSDEDHAYNVFKMNEDYYLLDSTNPFVLFDSNDNYAGCQSYIYRIESDKVVDFMKNKHEIKLPKCNLMRSSSGTLIEVDKDNIIYNTTSKILNADDVNSFLNVNKKTL